MPLVEKKYFYRSNLSWGLWHITETLEELVEIIDLNYVDASYLEKIGHDKKKKEFLAGRIVLKQLLEYYDLPYKGVIKDDILKPYLLGSKHNVSISHSHDYATAVIDPENKTAIDIELVSDKLLVLAPKFLTDEEMAFCGNDLQKITFIWCAKETLYKIYHGRGLIFKEHLFVRTCPDGNEGMMATEISIGSQKWMYQMHYLVRDGYVITFIEE